MSDAISLIALRSSLACFNFSINKVAGTANSVLILRFLRAHRFIALLLPPCCLPSSIILAQFYYHNK
eukprot:scaffold1669_cov99-Skeletonema_dohrnii-CCMP3373.AAC.6